jgi:hypothetical protein
MLIFYRVVLGLIAGSALVLIFNGRYEGGNGPPLCFTIAAGSLAIFEAVDRLRETIVKGARSASAAERPSAPDGSSRRVRPAA